MTAKRKRYSAEFKSKVALEALKGHKTLNELASAYQVDHLYLNGYMNYLQKAHKNKNYSAKEPNGEYLENLSNNH